jgi:hypothetical protein
VLVALALLATVFVLLMQVQRSSIAKAASARAHSIAARLGEQLIHRIEAGMVPDLEDGFRGDFSEEGFGNFSYVLGVGDGGGHAGAALDDAEAVLREFRERAEDEDEDEVLPEKTRIYLTISFPSYRSQDPENYRIETLVDSWALEQDFALFEDLWPDLLPTEIQ